MDKMALINELAQSKAVERVVEHYSPDRSLLYDLSQEIYVILLDYPDDKLFEIHTSGKLVPFVKSIARRQFFSSTSPFYYRYRFNKKNEIYIDGYEGNL